MNATIVAVDLAKDVWGVAVKRAGIMYGCCRTSTCSPRGVSPRFGERSSHSQPLDEHSDELISVPRPIVQGSRGVVRNVS